MLIFCKIAQNSLGQPLKSAGESLLHFAAPACFHAVFIGSHNPFENLLFREAFRHSNLFCFCMYVFFYFFIFFLNIWSFLEDFAAYKVLLLEMCIMLILFGALKVINNSS